MEKDSTHRVIALVLFLAITPVVIWSQAAYGEQSNIIRTSASVLLMAVVIGVIYNLWRTTRAYGGLIGQGIRWVGIGILFFAILALDRIAQGFSQAGLLTGLLSDSYTALVEDVLLLLGLLFSGLGFIKLFSAVKK